MNETSLLNLYFSRRADKISLYATESEQLQLQQLNNLLKMATSTRWGSMYGYASITGYEDFARRVPIQTYESLKGYIDEMRHGAADVLWPGRCQWFAKSSGTTNDKSKFIPVTQDGLKRVHYAGGVDSMALYLQNNPESRIFSGKALILGGSHASNYNTKKSLVGDLSAILIENCTPFVNFLRAPSKSIALLSDFEHKMDKIARYTINRNITSISGVPSWMMAVLKHALEITGKSSIEEIWPNLEVFFHGGVAFGPYRDQYLNIIKSTQMRYMETYNASEGFFGIQNDLCDPAMQLIIDNDVFYEFIPFDELDSISPRAIPLWDVEVGVNYAMVISTSCGLWRYLLGDTVRFTQTKPYKFTITGRTKHFINAFGEELIVDNAEQGISQACASTGALVNEYTAAPVYMDAQARCRHQWLIEFTNLPDSLDHFATILDNVLQQVNSDYEAKRYKNLTLQPLEVIVARNNLFNDWLKSKGKLGGQHKVPRLSNSREYIDEMIAINH